MFIIYPNSEFHVPNFDGPFDINIKVKADFNSPTASMLFHILEKGDAKLWFKFFEDLLPQIHDPISIVTPTS
jgi:hypothetical protein